MKDTTFSSLRPWLSLVLSLRTEELWVFLAVGRSCPWSHARKPWRQRTVVWWETPGLILVCAIFVNYFLGITISISIYTYRFLGGFICIYTVLCFFLYPWISSNTLFFAISLGASQVSYETGPCEQRAGRDQRKRQIISDWQVADFITKETYLLGVSWAVARWVVFQTCQPES